MSLESCFDRGGFGSKRPGRLFPMRRELCRAIGMFRGRGFGGDLIHGDPNQGRWGRVR